LRETGYGDDSKLTETDNSKAWGEFAKNDPGKAISGIINYLVHEDLSGVKSEMKGLTNAKNNHLNMSEYGNGDEAGVRKYLEQKYTNPSKLSYLGDENKKQGKDEITPPFHRMNNWKMWAAYGIPTLVIIGLVVYFWQNIVNWWNGPVEEGEEKDNE